MTLVYPPSIIGFGKSGAHPESLKADASPGAPAVKLELIVAQTPIVGPSQTFTAPGLTLGGEQSWNYVFDFQGLKQ